MNFVGKFDSKLSVDGPDVHSGTHFHVDSSAIHAPADAIIVPDAHLLFGGDYKRSGVDLILSDGDREFVLHDYFKGETRAALASPDGGAHLTGDIVNALTGHVEYAQAGGASAAAAVVVGHVTKLIGSASAIRNGVSIILNQGDNVDKGDVLQSGADSTLGVTFVDGTVFGLSSNARMVVNELVYDPNGSNNSSLLSLVQGTISFVAGETAKHGDMKVDTPVATMGIRGTAVLVQIDFDFPGGTPDAKFQVLVEPDGHTGSYILYDKTTLDPIATVNQAGHQVNINHGAVTYSTNGLSPELQKLITDVFAIKFTDNTNPNTKSSDHFTDTIVPLLFTPFKFANTPNVPQVVLVMNIVSGPFTESGPLSSLLQHIPGAPAVAAHDGALIERIGVTGDSALDTVSGKISFLDVNAGDRPTVSVTFDNAFTYENAQHQDVTATLTAEQLADIKAVAVKLAVEQDPGNTNNGSATWTYSVPDSAFDFIAAGETLTLTYMARVDNNYAPNDEAGFQQFTITITRGSNDVPVITSSVPQAIAFDDGTSVTGGNLVAQGPTSGTMSFSDPDLTDTHTVSAELVGTVLDGNAVTLPPTPLKILEAALSASLAADSTDTGGGTINWQLADLPAYLGDFIPKGETLTLTYAVTVTDSQGATSTPQDITVTITGTDASAVVWIATTDQGSPSGGLWRDGANWETGTAPTANDDVVIITNQLIGLTPSYPVTIDAAADAKSLTMNDFGSSAPKLINDSTLTVGGAFNMSADAVVENHGAITVGGLMEVQDQSVVHNFGALTLEQGGDFTDQSTISNAGTGTIEIAAGTLDVEVDIANSGRVIVDQRATLTLDGAAVTGGALTNSGMVGIEGSSGATLDGVTVTGSGTIQVDIAISPTTLTLQNGTTVTGGKLTMGPVGTLAVKSAAGATLNNVRVTNDDSIEVFAASLLALAAGTTVANKGTVTVDSTGTLTLNDASISGGTIADNGMIHVTGDSAIDSAGMTGGQVTVDAGQALTLDNVTVSYTGITETAANSIIRIDGGDTLTLYDATITGGAIDDYSIVSGKTVAGHIDITGSSTISDASLNHGDVTIDAGQTLTLDNVTVSYTSFDDTAAGSIIRIDGGDTLRLYDATITGGAIDDYSTVSGKTVAGHIDITGSSTISDASLNRGDVTIEGGQTLTLDNVTVTGTNFDDTAKAGATIHVDSGDTLTLNGATIVGGAVEVIGSLEIAGSSTIDNAVLNNAHVTVDSGQTLTLSGVVAAGSTITLAGTHDTLSVGSTFGGTIAGMSDGDTIKLADLAYSASETAVWNGADNTLTISNGTQTEVLKLAGTYSQNDFALAQDGSGHTEVLWNDAPVALGVLNSNGNAVAGTILTAAVTDPDAADITYTWLENGQVIPGQNSPSFTPPAADLGKTLDVVIGFTEGGITEQVTEPGGVIAAPPDHAPVIVGETDPSVQTVILQRSPDVHDGGAGLNPFGWFIETFDHFHTGHVSDSHIHLTDPITGTLTVSDADIGDTLTASVTGDAVAEYNGSTVLPPNADIAALIDPKTLTFDSVTSDGGSDVLDWAYNSGSASFDFLKPGDTLTLTFDAQVSDGHVITGDQPLTVTVVGAGGSIVKGTPQNDTFVDVGGGVTIFGKGGQDSFVFNENFHSATLADFDVNKDTIDIDHSLFASVSAILASAHPANFGHDTIITDAAHDKITLTGVTLAQLQAHPNDFHLI